MTTTPSSRRGSAALGSYGRLWAAVPREVGYLLLTFVIAVVSFTVTLMLVNAGIGTLVTFFIGVVVLVAALYVARGFGTVERSLLRWTGLPAIARPDWGDDRARRGFLGWVGAVLGNGHYWLHLLWAALVNVIVSTVTFALTVAWLAASLGGLTYWFWSRFVPEGDDDRIFPASLLLSALGIPVGADPGLVDAIAAFVLGLVTAATLPFVARGLAWAHWGVARGMLGPFRNEALRQQVDSLTESRTAAAAAEGAALRRLERDIHDGPQQRLVRLQLDLASAERQLDRDPNAARALIGGAAEQSREALEELRALSRGFAPPLLLDRGLLPALAALADRSPVPTRLTDEIPDGIELPVELERNLYFVAAEALTNVAKHADATSAQLRLGIRRIPESDETRLDLEVHDDGRGGAVITPGHGTAGLVERIRGMAGVLELSSPAGGPTLVAARVPLVR